MQPAAAQPRAVGPARPASRRDMAECIDAGVADSDGVEHNEHSTVHGPL
jgi:hypothetical protein